MATDLSTREIEINDLTEGERNKKTARSDFWKLKIENAKKVSESWLKEANDNYNIYYNTSVDSKGAYNYYSGLPGDRFTTHSYNLFYSNVEIKRPLIYSKLPTIDIRRRYRDRDHTSRIVSEILERVCNYFLDSYKYDIEFKKVVLDKIVTGRGMARIVYEPGLTEKFDDEGEIEKDSDGNVIQKTDINLKKIRIEFVPYDRVLMDTAKSWEEVSWIAFKHQLSKTDVAEIIGKSKADKLNYPDSVLTGINIDDNEKQNDELKVVNTRLTVWEIWDKIERKIILFAPNADDPILKESEDSYNLEDFFPIPRPLGLLSNNLSIVPIPEFRHYKIQYLELQEVEDRIRNLVKQVKACGVYNNKLTSTDAKNILNEQDGVVSPVSFPIDSDLKKMFYMKDIISIVNTIQNLLVQKAQIINDIREITGISDIIRGVSQAQETATAQKLKGDFAISRINPDQQEMEYYIRDVLRLMAEMVAENYTIDELVTISGIDVIDIEQISQLTKTRVLEQSRSQNLNEDEEAQLIQQTVQQVINQVNTQLNTTFSVTTAQLPEVNRILKDDKFRSFNIDIETESTIKIDNDIEKAQRIELLTAFSNSLNALLPLQQAGQITPEAVKEFIGFIIRPFKVGRNLEEAMIEKQDTSERDKRAEQLQQAQMQMMFEKEIALPNRKLDIEQQKIDNQHSQKQAEIESDELKTEIEAETDITVAEINAEGKDQNNKNKEKEDK